MKNSFKFKSRKEWEGFVWEKFLENIKKDSSEKATKFLNRLLTNNEKKIIIKRLLTLSLINKGKSYRKIGEILWISPSTISSLKKSVLSGLCYDGRKKPSNKNKKFSGKIKESSLFDYWLNFPVPPMIGKGRWKFLNYQG